MRICQVQIENFRGIAKGKIVLPPHAALLGPNNTGKSSVVEALALLFARERMVRPISDWDFFGGAPTPEMRFYVVATITDFGSDDPLDAPDWFVGHDCAVPVWWDAENEQVSYATDRKEGSTLAAQVAVAGRYDDDDCEFEVRRYFYQPGDPFLDDFPSVPQSLLRELGFFLLPSNRDWDRLLSFSSSSLLKLMRENKAIPGAEIEELKRELREDVTKVETSGRLSVLLAKAADEMRSFEMITSDASIVYRPTALDSISVLQSLTPHVASTAGELLPIARHGAGMVSLQSFLVLLGFAEHRRALEKNFTLAAEEPELHLHPSLHRRLAHRVRSSSTQSIVTTQSPQLASSYPPSEVVFLRNARGILSSTIMRKEPLSRIQSKSVRRLYLTHRASFFEALMGQIVLVPEGIFDFEALTLWQNVAFAVESTSPDFQPTPVCVAPTHDAAVVETLKEVRRFRPEAIPLLDGDPAGDSYLAQVAALTTLPSRCIRHGSGAGIECVSAWILEPTLSDAGSEAVATIPDGQARTLKNLQAALIARKDDRDLRERLAWSIVGSSEASYRCQEYFNDLAAIATGRAPSNHGWKSSTTDTKLEVLTATHIARE